MIVRPLTQDFDWDQYVDLTIRAFGPVDEAMVQPVIEPAVAAGRCLGASNSTVAETVRAQVGPPDPLWWMLREQDANIAERESWMLRVLDAPAAIAGRGFPATDLAVPLLITDDLRPANAGRWDLTVRGRRRPPFQIPNGLPFSFPRRLAARRAGAAGAGCPRPRRAIRGDAGRDAAPGRPGRWRRPGR